MNRSSLALVILFFVSAVAHSQSVARAKQPGTTNSLISEVSIETEATDERILAARCITALKHLDDQVLVYRSL
jgi:hypothetical protein